MHRCAMRHTGIVQHKIHPPMLADNSISQSEHGIAVGNINQMGFTADTCLFNFIQRNRQHIGAHIGHHHICAFCRQSARASRANATGRAGDNTNFIVKLFHADISPENRNAVTAQAVFLGDNSLQRRCGRHLLRMIIIFK